MFLQIGCKITKNFRQHHNPKPHHPGLDRSRGHRRELPAGQTHRHPAAARLRGLRPKHLLLHLRPAHHRRRPVVPADRRAVDAPLPRRHRRDGRWLLADGKK